MKYFYDTDGAVEYLLSKTDQFDNPKAYNLYFYMKNGEGNVIGLVKVKSQSGTGTAVDKTLVAEYKYDFYGQVLSATNLNGETIGTINPLRYRGYYYDQDTGWYNLQTRNYDPVVCRFVSADAVDLVGSSSMSLKDTNLYTYCNNNPVNFDDHDGQISLRSLIRSLAVKVVSALRNVSRQISKNPVIRKIGTTIASRSSKRKYSYTTTNTGKGFNKSRGDKELTYVVYKTTATAASGQSFTISYGVNKSEGLVAVYCKDDYKSNFSAASMMSGGMGDEIIRTTRSVAGSGALSGRTDVGVIMEIKLHAIAAYIVPDASIRGRANPADIGSVGKDDLGYDQDSYWFEGGIFDPRSWVVN
ncbi:MAG: RHS repeat-associated core domain-containing protein [Bacillota bacterium]